MLRDGIGVARRRLVEARDLVPPPHHRHLGHRPRHRATALSQARRVRSRRHMHRLPQKSIVKRVRQERAVYLLDHAWGQEALHRFPRRSELPNDTGIRISNGQVLMRDYSCREVETLLREKGSGQRARAGGERPMRPGGKRVRGVFCPAISPTNRGRSAGRSAPRPPARAGRRSCPSPPTPWTR